MPKKRKASKRYYSMWMEEADLKSLDELASDRNMTRNQVINQLIREKINEKKESEKPE